MALKDLDFKPLEVWAREAIATGDAAGMTIARSNKPGGSSWEAHGFPVDESLLDTFKGRAGAMFKSKRLAPVVEIPLDELTSLQGGVWRDKMNTMLATEHEPTEGERDANGYLVDYPRVIRFGGKLYLYDGNHRLEAQRREGATSALVRLVDLDELEGRGA